MTEPEYEWLESDGLGGFASHTSLGTRTRRYHALLLVSKKPPTDRRVLVNGVDVVAETGGKRLALTSQTYRPASEGDAPVIGHDGAPLPFQFDHSPWPCWTYELEDGRKIEYSILVAPGSPRVLLSWQLIGEGGEPVTLAVRPFLSGRDYHSMHHENPDFNFTAHPDSSRGRVEFQPYAGEPAVVAISNGTFEEEPHWYRNFFYATDHERGLDSTEDLGTPGLFRFSLDHQPARLVFGTHAATTDMDARSLDDEVRRIQETERSRRLGVVSALERAASSYLVDRGNGRTILAGYPWFTDWGRDTFISLRGLCLATGRLREARRVLVQWSTAVSEGMLPNRFTDSDEAPEFNSVDASLWFVVAVHDLRLAENRAGYVASTVEEWQLNAAIVSILRGYAAGTRHGIRMDEDRLLAAGEPGAQLTWMDAKVGDFVVTPRTGKPVEIQALWINALRIGAQIESGFAEWAEQAEAAFGERFFNEEAGYLFDVVDVDHVAGQCDGRIRPNALFAIGGLPFQVVRGDRARAVVDVAEAKLLTPAGPRSLSPDAPQYCGAYRGGVWSRDTAYHQGTVWPFLMGAFVEAWVRTRGRSKVARHEARQRFLNPMITLLDPHGIGHLPEITDGDGPHAPRGCPFQAWSVGEALRIDRVILARD